MLGGRLIGIGFYENSLLNKGAPNEKTNNRNWEIIGYHDGRASYGYRVP